MTRTFVTTESASTDSLSYGSTNSNRRFYTYVAIAFVLYLIIGFAGGELTISHDGHEYLQMAMHLSDDGRFTYDGVHPVIGKPPGFPFIVAFFVSIGSPGPVLQLAQMLFVFASYLLIAAAARRWLGEFIGYAVLGVLVVSWPLYYFVHNLLSEAPFLAFTALSLYALMRFIDERRLRWVVICGLASGLSAYIRPINVLWPFFALVGVAWIHRSLWKPVFLVVLIHTAILAPWVVRNYNMSGRFVPIAANWGPVYYMTDEDLWQTYLFDGPGAVQQTQGHLAITQGEHQFNLGPSERFRDLALKNIASDPGAYLWRCVRQAAFVWTYVPWTKEWYKSHWTWFWLGRAGMLIGYGILAVGLWSAPPRRNPLSLVAITYTMCNAVFMSPVCTESRYLVPAYVWILPLGLAGIVRIRASFTTRRRHRR